MIRVGLPLYFCGLTGLYTPEYAINKDKPSKVFRVAGSISNFAAAISANGGMSMTNGYDVQFDLSGNTVLSTTLTQKEIGIDVAKTSDAGAPGSLINLFCDEAQLPAMQFATGQINGRYQGRGNLNYAHTRLITDFSLTWMCDANMAPYKFLTVWYNYIQGTTVFVENASNLKNFKTFATAGADNLSYRLRYPNEYQATLRIAKTERGANAPNSRASLVHTLTNVYPYSIDAVPLSYGTSQITRVTANFYYDRMRTTMADIRKFKG